MDLRGSLAAVLAISGLFALILFSTFNDFVGGVYPLRTMLIAVILMGVLGAVFTLREWAWLYIAGIWLYLVLVPFVEAAEQTIIQQVVPLHQQGRVFGFAMAFGSAAAPITAFLIASIAQVWIIPHAARLPDAGLPRGLGVVHKDGCRGVRTAKSPLS